MIVSVSVMAHPKRAAFVTELVEALDAEPTVVWDEENDRWHTGRRALLAYDPQASHHLVVQDDVIPCRDLVAGVEQAIQWVPEQSPIMLYVGKVRPYRKVIEQAAREAGGASWLTFKQTFWGPGLVIPTSHIDDLVAWCDSAKIPNYDRRIGLWYRKSRTPVYATWPSLVEHRDSPSLVAGRNGGRHAHRFLGADVSALTVDWSGPVRHVNVGT